MKQGIIFAKAIIHYYLFANRFMIRTYFRYIVFLLILVSSVRVSAQKDDTLIHINGNIMTGEIKKMVDGILYFKMDGMGTISVEAEKIIRELEDLL